MLACLFSGILHPIIHLGHALESGGNDSLDQGESDPRNSLLRSEKISNSHHLTLIFDLDLLRIVPCLGIALAETAE